MNLEQIETAVEGGSVTVIETDSTDSMQLRKILHWHLPQIIELFSRKHKQYGENAFELGEAAQYPEIWRKVKRLRQLIWDKTGEDEFEDTVEIIDDLVGHLLLLRECLVVCGKFPEPKPSPYSGPVPRITEAELPRQHRHEA